MLITITKRRGGIPMETVALILLIASGYLADMYLSRFGDNWGYAGVVLGPALLIAIIHSIAWTERQFFIGQSPLPKCKCGFKPIEELKDAPDTPPYTPGKGKKVCTCGTYLIGRGIIKYQQNNSEAIDYAYWSCGKWQMSSTSENKQ